MFKNITTGGVHLSIEKDPTKGHRSMLEYQTGMNEPLQNSLTIVRSIPFKKSLMKTKC